jgi:hypothetical protein
MIRGGICLEGQISHRVIKVNTTENETDVDDWREEM